MYLINDDGGGLHQTGRDDNDHDDLHVLCVCGRLSCRWCECALWSSRGEEHGLSPFCACQNSKIIINFLIIYTFLEI